MTTSWAEEVFMTIPSIFPLQREIPVGMVLAVNGLPCHEREAWENTKLC